MIRTVWLAIACLIGLAALTVIRVGTTSLEATGPSDQTTGSSLIADASSSDASPLGTLPKGDRLERRRRRRRQAGQADRDHAQGRRNAPCRNERARAEVAQLLRQTAGRRRKTSQGQGSQDGETAPLLSCLAKPREIEIRDGAQAQEEPFARVNDRAARGPRASSGFSVLNAGSLGKMPGQTVGLFLLRRFVISPSSGLFDRQFAARIGESVLKILL